MIYLKSVYLNAATSSNERIKKKQRLHTSTRLLFVEWRDLISSWYQWNYFEFSLFLRTEFMKKKNQFNFVSDAWARVHIWSLSDLCKSVLCVLSRFSYLNIKTKTNSSYSIESRQIDNRQHVNGSTCRIHLSQSYIFVMNSKKTPTNVHIINAQQKHDREVIDSFHLLIFFQAKFYAFLILI